MNFNLAKRVFAEFLGTAFLLAIVVGSGIMGEKLSQGNLAIALLANTLATGAGLVFLILIFECFNNRFKIYRTYLNIYFFLIYIEI